MTPFEAAVAKVIRHIPFGRTLGYGQVALLAGAPRGARAVVRALHSLTGVPWWRVVRSDGTVAEAMAAKQVPKLRAEGVRVVGRRVSPACHGFDTTPKRPATRSTKTP